MTELATEQASAGNRSCSAGGALGRLLPQEPRVKFLRTPSPFLSNLEGEPPGTQSLNYELKV